MIRLFFRTIVIFFGILIFSSCKNQTKETANQVDKNDFLNRTPSFSYIFIENNQVNEIVEFLNKLDYKLISKETLTGDYKSIYENLELITDSNTVVRKGVFYKNGYTVLIDPEMVVATMEEELIMLSDELQTKIIAAIWERLSHTRALIIIGPDGLKSRTYFTEGEIISDNINPNALLLKNNSEIGIYKALDSLNIPLGELFNNKMTIEKLTLSE